VSAAFTPTRYKLSVEDYHKLGDAGILNEDSRGELIEGELIQMAPIGVAHMGLVNRLNKLLVIAVGDRGVVSVQNGVTMPPYSEPQPDFAILVPGADRITGDLPGPTDVLLLIEVADTTLAYDRKVKLPLYAQKGIAEVWIVNVQARCIETYREPTANGYQGRTDVGPEDRASPHALPDVQVELKEIFR